MTLLIQISDPHFGTEQAAVVEALVRLVHQQAPSLVVLSGDITQRARREQFRAARAFVDALKVPAVLAIPGNHDVPLFNLWARAFMPYAHYSRAFGTDLEPVFESATLLAVAVNTTRRYRHKDGAVSDAQIARVAARFAQAAPEQVRIAVVHQPVLVTQTRDVPNLLHGHEAAVHAWAAAGCDLVMGGHIHLPYVRPLHDGFPRLPRRMWAVQAGTAVSARVRHEAANSVNLVRCAIDRGHRRCAVERWDFRPAAAAFEPVDTHDLDLDDVRDAG
jgi:3',5'-cyclic AMP phosphodiesterase CpdA